MTQAPEPPPKPSDAYRAAGVDIEAGNVFVDAIKPHAARTARPGVVANLGGFGGLFDLKACGFKDPLLVAATDGVGTKLLVARAAETYRGLGIDLVAMSVNDVVVQGAEPLFFLDYLATGKLEPEVAAAVVEGIADGCVESGCALIGGETAEMPGVYAPGDFDLAGFCVGAVERTLLLPRVDAIEPGDAVIGLASDGLHANGFSLVRKIVADGAFSYRAPAPFAADVTLGDALLAPTRLYPRAARALRAAVEVRALAHITGGGLIENLPRVLPKGLQGVIDLDSFELPPLFRWLAEQGRLDRLSLARTFNCGVGLMAVVAADAAGAAVQALNAAGERAWKLGHVQQADNAGGAGVVLKGGSVWPQK